MEIRDQFIAEISKREWRPVPKTSTTWCLELGGFLLFAYVDGSFSICRRMIYGTEGGLEGAKAAAIEMLADQFFPKGSNDEVGDPEAEIQAHLNNYLRRELSLQELSSYLARVAFRCDADLQRCPKTRQLAASLRLLIDEYTSGHRTRDDLDLRLADQFFSKEGKANA